MKNTPLTNEHIALGANMANFAGYNMPITYPIGVKVEHQTVREKVGVFDVSHMGEFLVEGKGALPLIQEVTSNNAARLTIGQAQYSCLPNHEGGIVDDLLVYKMGEEKYLLVVNASNIEKDWNWIVQHNKHDAKLTNISDDIALLAVQGPKTAETLQGLTSVDLASMKYYTFEEGTFAGVEGVIISATGYTGSGGFELYIPKNDALHVWKAVLEAGKDFGIEAIGLAARDTLRLEMGFALYGNDIDDTTSPIAAGLGWITKTKKGQFNSVEIFQQERKKGTAQKLVGFELLGRGVPRHDYLIVDANDNQIGKVTSGTHSPSLSKGIGMGYVDRAFSKVGSEFFIAVRKKRIPAVVVKLPFYKV